MVHGRPSLVAHIVAFALPCLATIAGTVACSSSEAGFETSTEGDAGALSDAAPRDAARDAIAQEASATPCTPPASLPDLPTTTSYGLAAAFHQGVCTSADVRAFYNACLGSNAASSACTAWRNANGACGSCLLTARGSTRMGPFHTDPSQPASNENPASLVTDWGRAIVATCVNAFVPGCGEPALDLDTCQTRACAPSGACAGVAPTVLAACRAQATQASFACRAPYLTREAACAGVFERRDAATPGGETCFPVSGEDTATPSGAETYLERLALAFCGP